jgi:hypothetical protein
MDEWSALHGPQRGTVIVYEVPTESDLLLVWDHIGREGAVFHEPDLNGQATAFATIHGPLDLPLLGSLLDKAKKSWEKKARSRARAASLILRPVAVDLPSPPTILG